MDVQRLLNTLKRKENTLEKSGPLLKALKFFGRSGKGNYQI